jgi:urea transport system substrate-binding protein
MSQGDPALPEDDQFRTLTHAGQNSAGDESHPRGQDSTFQDGIRKKAGRLSKGERLGRYEITDTLGAGGMGVVYKAHDAAIDRDVAIKVLSADVSVNFNALNRFTVEARAAGKLSHPNTVGIYEIGESAGIHYLVMEFAPGGSVLDRLERDGAFSALEATRITIDAAKGLSAAHKAGILHRDMKPANLLISADGAVKIADFGLAKPTLGGDHQLTRQGQILGTPYYMSPEQCETLELDHRSDIYSLGATYYALLTGANPYADAGSVIRVMRAHCEGEVLDPRKVNGLIPNACAGIVARATAKRPEDRYQSVEEMRADLEGVYATLSGDSIVLPSQSGIITRSSAVSTRRSRPYLIAMALLFLVATLGALAAWWRSNGVGAGGESVEGVVKSPLAAAPSGPPVNVGVLNSLTGAMGASGSATIDATLLAIDEVNQAGGVLGRPVVPIVRDTRSHVENFAPEAERLIAEDRVSVIFGCWTSSGRKSVVPIVEKHDNLLVYPRSYEGIEESPNVFYLGSTPNQQIIPAVRWANDTLKKRRFFLVGSDYVFPRIANEIIKLQIEEIGAELAGEAYRPLGSDDFDGIAADIAAAKPDCILSTVSGDSAIAFIQALRKAGVTPAHTPTISFSIGEEEILHLDVSQVAGDYAAGRYFQSIDTEENRRFISKFRAKFGPQRVLTDPMEAAYMGVKLWAAAVNEAGSLETRLVRQAMRGIRLPSPGGETRIDPATHHAFRMSRIGRVKGDGQFEIVWTADKPIAPEPYPIKRSAEEWRAVLHDLQRSWNGQWAAPEQ